MTDQHTNPQLESRVIPWWSYVLAVGFFIGVQTLIYKVLVPLDPRPKPFAFTFVWGILLGMFLAFYMLMIGYVTRDAKKRGMNPTVWLFIMISLLPSGVGFIVYFLLRQPVKMNCPRCTGSIQHGFNYCPKCQFQFNPVCDHCQRTLHSGDTYCSHCGSATSDKQRMVAVK